MSVVLSEVLRSNMDKWEYDNNGKMVALENASEDVIRAVKVMNEIEEMSEIKDIADV